MNSSSRFGILQVVMVGYKNMGINKVILLSVLLLLSMLQAEAQIKLVPEDKLMSVSSPQLSRDSSALAFLTKHIVADPMSEDDPPVKYSFVFTNISRSEVEIKRIVSTCSCVQAICAKRIVGPGEKAEIIVTYNPKGHPGKFERKIFLYTQEHDNPAVVLRLSVDVENNLDLSGLYPVSMGKIRLRRTVVRFVEDKPAVEKLRFVNVSGKVLSFDCDRMFLPDCLSFYAPSVHPMEEAELVIKYDPSKKGAKQQMKIFMNGLGVNPSQSSLTVYLD